jgi:hypothetical protein
MTCGDRGEHTATCRRTGLWPPGPQALAAPPAAARYTGPDSISFKVPYPAWMAHHRRARCRRSALRITDTELALIAALAMIGDSSRPNSGYSAPAATGTPSAL